LRYFNHIRVPLINPLPLLLQYSVLLIRRHLEATIHKGVAEAGGEVDSLEEVAEAEAKLERAQEVREYTGSVESQGTIKLIVMHISGQRMPLRLSLSM
jgi:hypothetical protein